MKKEKRPKEYVAKCRTCYKPVDKPLIVWGECFEEFCSEMCRKQYFAKKRFR